MSVFDEVVNFVIDQLEGSYANDPSDPGGETVYGIARTKHPALAPWPPTREQAVSIYCHEYWEPINGDQLPPAVAVVVYDAAVNEGVGFAKRLLQRALRVNVDGVIGSVTVGAARAREPEQLIVTLLVDRALTYQEDPNAPRFGRTWLTRLFMIHRFALRYLS